MEAPVEADGSAGAPLEPGSVPLWGNSQRGGRVGKN